jgi:hypothetical protein
LLRVLCASISGRKERQLLLPLARFLERDSNFIERNEPATQIRLRWTKWRWKKRNNATADEERLDKKGGETRDAAVLSSILKITLPVVVGLLSEARIQKLRGRSQIEKRFAVDNGR